MPGTPTSVRTAALLAMQAPQGVPQSDSVATLTNPLAPPMRTADMLAHLPDSVYDKSPESHLIRLLKILLGDAGAGGLRKQYLYSQLSQVLLTSHFTDLDRLYGAVFGFPRLSGETLDIDPYYQTADADEWEVLFARDASYRARIEQFSRAIAWGATPTGMLLASQALLGVECRLYETYVFVDEATPNPGGAPAPVAGRLYSDVQNGFATYGDMEAGTYGDVEGGVGDFGRTTRDNRSEFIIRPMRQITNEETYLLVKVLSRLKPAGALLTVDPLGVAVHDEVPLRRVSADSTYWQVRTRVAAKKENRSAYTRTRTDNSPVEQPRPAFTYYQGEAWSYNADVVTMRSYTQDAAGDLVAKMDYQRLPIPGGEVDYTPDQGLADPVKLTLGRYASDGVLATAPGRGPR